MDVNRNYLCDHFAIYRSIEPLHRTPETNDVNFTSVLKSTNSNLTFKKKTGL